MMKPGYLNGGLILIAGIALLIFLILKLIPNTTHDKDTTALLVIFTVVALGIIGMGSWICWS
ncbi:hypothetical protein FD13_GL000934 [Levilactobacillus senmaizukei DSM 21775 = NBRC 103853]|uniref:Uncharacterized protein n=1 Tax=Levilactobacillus senmaizukei DSM 21775 = NBRC 103853 TaxID=1423803 RepID=A0A0R2DJ99_9LACO|nr:hypothetical protein [Levilactobacillus senmaizukei]KRN03179.1 hypothetical protein FD13_GL000934 [Levilactobacillus senmaizukei DSM 21775 = NBRC 103853]